jgi:nucleotide-binding universal stress UspA family protein
MMGSHGHGSLTNLVMGSVATKVLAAAARRC